MFGFALAVAAASLIAFLVVLFLGLRFFGALAGQSRANEQFSEDHTQSVTPEYKRFDLSVRRRS